MWERYGEQYVIGSLVDKVKAIYLPQTPDKGSQDQEAQK